MIQYIYNICNKYRYLMCFNFHCVLRYISNYFKDCFGKNNKDMHEQEMQDRSEPIVRLDIEPILTASSDPFIDGNPDVHNSLINLGQDSNDELVHDETTETNETNEQYNKLPYVPEVLVIPSKPTIPEEILEEKVYDIPLITITSANETEEELFNIQEFVIL